MSSQRAPDIYVPMLTPLGHGYPLWLPDPPSNHPLGGTQIGDLGYLDNEGGFVYLFNVCKAADDPVNLTRTPPDFVRLTGIDDIADILTRTLFENDKEIHAVAEETKSIGADVSVQASLVPAALGSRFQFTSASTQATLLVLPDGATSHTCAKPGMFEDYATIYAHSWYKYFNGPGQRRQIPNGMLYLVTGCSKCRSWANACYSHTVESRAASLNLSIAGGGANVSGTLYCKWEVQSDSPVHHRSHPEPPTSVPYALIPHALAAVALIPLSLIAPSLTPALVVAALIVAAVLLRRYPNLPNLPEATENQTIFLHGFSISVYEKSAMKFRLKEKVKLCEKPPQDSSIPYSAAPQSSTTLTATETGTAQGHGAGMERGTARSLNFDDSEIEGSSYDEYSGSGGSESLEDETGTDVPAMDIPYGYTTTRADTLVQRLPGWGKIVNPSALINKHILDTYPDATIALTHDDFEWTGMEDNVRNPLNVMELAKYAIDNNLVSINENETTPNAWVAKRRDIVIDRFPRQNDIFALVIGIDKYQCKEYKDLQGACSDADKFEAYLVEALGTPKANIISLRDGHATRSAIIDKLVRMKDNANTQRDTVAIVLYFAGYGAATTDPVGRADGNTSNEKIGMLCPTDIGVLDKSGDVVNGIPARTINQLLLELSLAHGNNITLILDCSYAALPSDTQKPADVPAGAERRQIFDPPKLSPSCDQQIYSGPGKKLVPEFGSSLLDSHVLLTACSPLQFAYESQGGGLFTRALLKVMKERPIGNLTYKSLIRRLDMPGYQTPLSEGRHINRRLFDSRDRTA